MGFNGNLSGERVYSYKPPPRQFQRYISFFLLAWVTALCVITLISANKNYLTRIKCVRTKSSVLNKLVCGATNVGGQYCSAPCWNGAPYKEPGFILKPNFDKAQHNITVLMYMYSAVENTERRNVMRKAFYAQFIELPFTKLVFVIGTRIDKSFLNMSTLQSESTVHDDILQIDIEDTYNNLGFKAIGIYKWVKEFDKTIQLLVKVDDDSLGILARLKKYVKLLNKERSYLKNSMICGQTIHNSLAFERKLKKKWESSVKQYYATYFPSFCEGSGGIFVSRQTAFKLYEAAKDRRVFHLDDVYITGLLRQRACLELVDSSTPLRILTNILYKIGTNICNIFYSDPFS